MDILQIVIIGMTGTILSVMLKKHSPEFSLITGVATGVLIFILLLSYLSGILDILKDMAEAAGIRSAYLETVLKVIGIAYIAEFGVQVCSDAGEGSIASKIELAGKVLIMVVSAPILFTLLDTIMNLLV